MFRRFIFTATAGRTGTRYLMQVLQNCDGVLAEHEALPTPGRLLRRMNLGMPWAAYAAAWSRQKAIDLVGLPEDTRRSHSIVNQWHTYADTSHVLCKSALHPSAPLLVDAIRQEVPDAEIKIVLLERDERKTAASLIGIGVIPSLWANPLGFGLTPYHPFTSRWNDWESVVLRDAHDKPESLPGRIALALWYLREIRLIQDRMAAVVGEEHVVRARIEDLNTIDACHALVRALGLTPTGHMENVVGKPANTSEARRIKRPEISEQDWRAGYRIFRRWLVTQDDSEP